MMRCPDCNSKRVIHNGTNIRGETVYRCEDCGEQFIDEEEE